jgi:catalase-peroxidase
MSDTTEHAATQGACPFRGTRIGGAIGSAPQLDHWWPERLKVELLNRQGKVADPLGEDFDYAAAVAAIDHEQLEADVLELLRNPVDWWPADYGHYGPQMCRMSWHSAGTYRIADGRGGGGTGMQRFAPVGSWWDNGNIDKSRRLLMPIKLKYGSSLSWADLILFAGTVGMKDMGLPIQGFAFGRRDAWEADDATYWGPEGWMGKRPGEQDEPGSKAGHPEHMVNRGLRWEGEVDEDRYDLENPLAASHQSLIYVDPEGPRGNGCPMSSARDIRETFKRMAMNDEETVALIAGGHAFGKSHGMTPHAEIGPAPEGAPLSSQGLGWHNPRGKGNAEDTMTNGIEGSWTPNPTQWDNSYLENLFKYEWEQTRSPAGALQWKPKDPDAPKTPDAHIPGKMNELMMMTSDLALKTDPAYRKICERYLEDFDAFTKAFSEAWHKLMHRDMGPKSRYVGPDVGGDFLWQDPVPDVDHPLVDDADIAALKKKCLETGLPVRELIAVAFASASTYRDSDKRGGANGGRIRLAPLRSWKVNAPEQLGRVLDALQGVKDAFDTDGGKRISMADLIVLAGAAAVEEAARQGGHDVTVPFTPGRTDATADQTDEEQMDYLRPVADGFRNFLDEDVRFDVAPEHLFLDRAALLGLSSWEWTALTGGLRVLDQNWDGSKHGVFTDRPGVLSNDFFTVLCSMDYAWKPHDDQERTFDLVTRDGGDKVYTATRCDLIFGSNAPLRQVAELYAGADGEERLVADFVRAWTKVMMGDRFDVPEQRRAAWASR